MIEREFINQKTKEFYIKQYVENRLHGVGISQIKLKKIPLGEKIIIHTDRPSLVVGSKGSNIRELTAVLKKQFKLENPQVEIVEVKNIFLDANIVAQKIAGTLERFGSARFKGVGHKTMENVINSGALGVELIISGKIPGARAKSWRFYQGYLKKCGDFSVSGVKKAQKFALLKSGVIGIKVAIMPSDLTLPDSVEILDEPVQVIEEISPEEIKTEKKTKKSSAKKNTKTKKKTVKKADGEEVKEVPVEEKKEEPVVEAPAVEETQSTNVDNTESETPVSEESNKETPVEKVYNEYT